MPRPVSASGPCQGAEQREAQRNTPKCAGGQSTDCPFDVFSKALSAKKPEDPGPVFVLCHKMGKISESRLHFGLGADIMSDESKQDA